jgi:hypothetical protein
MSPTAPKQPAKEGPEAISPTAQKQPPKEAPKASPIAGDTLPDTLTPDTPPSSAVQLTRTYEPPTPDQLLWAVIKDRSRAIQFNVYRDFMDRVLLPALSKQEQAESEAGEWGALERIVDRVNAYEVLKTATELFLMAECGLVPSPGSAKLTAMIESLESHENKETLLYKLNQLPADVTSGIRKKFGADAEELKKRYLVLLGESSESARVLPYYQLIIARLEELPPKPELVAHAAERYGILRDAATSPPMIELIWSYWHEQGMLVQSMAAIAARFQNRRMGSPDPLANLNIDPLRGANNLLWGWIQDEANRLTVRRRAYEYEHQYGLSIFGRAVPELDAADSRSNFLRCFHELLGLCVKFYEADDDTTVVADPFPVLNALKEVHMVLAEGAHNQFGDLPWTSRVEIMIMQWILARPEFREFLGGRTMVPYEEVWMDRVDSMRQLQGWGDTSVSQFRDLAVFGERILLSIRYGNWMTSSVTSQAANWARAWREEIQIYIHAYRTVTSVDLTAEPVDARAAQARYRQPSEYLRLQEAARTRQLSAAAERRG